MKKVIPIIFFILFLNESAYSQASQYQPQQIYRIFSENDFFLFRDRTDFYYTQGLKIEFLKELKTDHKLQNFWPFLFTNASQNMVGYTLGQNMYTPGDVTNTSVSTDDRPYAGWLYLGFTTISNIEFSAQRLTTDLYVGVIGPMALGEQVQRTWHDLINSSDPRGWEHQIRNDAGINLNFRYEKGLISYLSSNEDFAFDLIPIAEVFTGSVFNKLGIGTTVRISFLNSNRYFSNLIDSTGKIPSLLDPKSAAENGDQGKPTFRENFRLSNFSLFLRTSGRAVLYNSLLQGGLFNRSSPYTIENKDIERLYFDMDYGITYSTPYFNISYSRAFRTKEFRQQLRNHHWGQIYLTIKI